MLNPSQPKPTYDATDERAFRGMVADEFRRTYVRGQDIVLAPGAGPVLSSLNGTLYRLVVSNAGVLSTVAV